MRGSIIFFVINDSIFSEIVYFKNYSKAMYISIQLDKMFRLLDIPIPLKVTQFMVGIISSCKKSIALIR